MNLSKFMEVPVLHESAHDLESNKTTDNTYVEHVVLIKAGCTFDEVWAIAKQNRRTHPDEPVEWQKDAKGTYTLNRIVKINGT